MASRERSRRSVKMSRVEAKEKLVNRLREEHDEAIRKYEEEVAAWEAAQAQAGENSNVTSTDRVELGNVPNETEQTTTTKNNETKVEVNNMAKQLDFNLDDINANVDENVDISGIPENILLCNAQGNACRQYSRISVLHCPERDPFHQA